MGKSTRPGTGYVSEIVDRYLHWREIYGQEPDYSKLTTPQSRRTAEEALGADVLEVEDWLFGQRPKTLIEAICMLDVAAENLADGGRMDGADRRALAHVQQYMATLILPEPGQDEASREVIRLARRAPAVPDARG